MRIKKCPKILKLNFLGNISLVTTLNAIVTSCCAVRAVMRNKYANATSPLGQTLLLHLYKRVIGSMLEEWRGRCQLLSGERVYKY
jgi:hypothetical protein